MTRIEPRLPWLRLKRSTAELSLCRHWLAVCSIEQYMPVTKAHWYIKSLGQCALNLVMNRTFESEALDFSGYSLDSLSICFGWNSQHHHNRCIRVIGFWRLKPGFWCILTCTARKYARNVRFYKPCVSAASENEFNRANRILCLKGDVLVYTVSRLSKCQG